MICRTCNSDKPENEFYRNRLSCKVCVCLAVRRRARTNPAVQEYDRQRSKTPGRREHARSITIHWREQNPTAYKAQTAVGNALRDGKLRKEPCAFCGRGDVHGHHKDYSKPLDVIWLCPKCHHRLHAAFPELEGKMKQAS